MVSFGLSKSISGDDDNTTNLCRVLQEENARLRSEKEESAAAKNEKLQEIEEEKKKLNDLLKEREVTWQVTLRKKTFTYTTSLHLVKL